MWEKESQDPEWVGIGAAKGKDRTTLAWLGLHEGIGVNKPKGPCGCALVAVHDIRKVGVKVGFGGNLDIGAVADWHSKPSIIHLFFRAQTNPGYQYTLGCCRNPHILL